VRPPLGPIGLLAWEDGAGIDFAALRAARRERVRAELERQGIDVLVLGRRGNAKYVGGHRWLWRAVLTPFGPICAFARASGEIHLLGSTWDDGVPREIPTANLSALTWNPQNVQAALARVPGLASARRIGVDGMSPFLAQALAKLAPRAELVDGERLLRAVRAVKLPAEVACIRGALALAEGALCAVVAGLRPGTTETSHRARLAEELARYGTTVPAFEAVFCATPREADDRRAGPPLRLRPLDRPIGAGDLVACSAGVLYAGYEGAATRSWPCLGPAGTPSAAQRRLHARWRAALDAVVARCRLGTAPAELRKAWLDTGEPLPPVLLAHGIGLGVEPPIVGGDAGPDPGDAEPLQEDMVIAVQGYVFERGVGGYLGGETLLVTRGAPLCLSRVCDAPLGE
jgi:Xaa-Pro aminopeptidase